MSTRAEWLKLRLNMALGANFFWIGVGLKIGKESARGLTIFGLFLDLKEPSWDSITDKEFFSRSISSLMIGLRVLTLNLADLRGSLI